MRRVASIFLALLVVSSGAAAPASAQSLTDSDCDGLVAFIQNAAVLGLTGTTTEACSPTNNAIDDMKESDGNQTKVDIYSAASASDAHLQSSTAMASNYLNDSESVAWMKVQVAVAEAYQNGSTKAEAKVAAKEAISSYYAVKQKNLIDRWNTTASEWWYLREQAENETGINADFVDVVSTNPDGNTRELENFRRDTRQHTLVDGSTAYSMAIKSDSVDYDGETGSVHATGTNGGQYHNQGPLTVKAPNTNYDQLYYADNGRATIWNRIENKNSALQSEADNFVDATYDDFATGDANASDVISANTAMFEYGTEHDGNSSLYDSTAALAMMGFDTPNMSNSGTMDVSYNGNTYTGIVLARNAPGSSWETGTTYNTSNITGPVFLATTDGQKLDFGEGEEFTIDQMRAKDGSNTTQVNTTKYVYKTANTSELNEMQSQLIDLRKEIESREPDGGGGGSGFGSSQTVIAIAALAGAALLFNRGGQ